jgi:hypothetical protein
MRVCGASEATGGSCPPVPQIIREEDIYGLSLPIDDKAAANNQFSFLEVLPEHGTKVPLKGQYGYDLLEKDHVPTFHANYMARALLVAAAWRVAAFSTMFIQSDTGAHELPGQHMNFPPTSLSFEPFLGGKRDPQDTILTAIDHAFLRSAHAYESWAEEIDHIRFVDSKGDDMKRAALIKNIMTRSDNIA